MNEFVVQPPVDVIKAISKKEAFEKYCQKNNLDLDYDLVGYQFYIEVRSQ